jgi:hypothetical protein
VAGLVALVVVAVVVVIAVDAVEAGGETNDDDIEGKNIVVLGDVLVAMYEGGCRVCWYSAANATGVVDTIGVVTADVAETGEMLLLLRHVMMFDKGGRTGGCSGCFDEGVFMIDGREEDGDESDSD